MNLHILIFDFGCMIFEKICSIIFIDKESIFQVDLDDLKRYIYIHVYGNALRFYLK